MKVYATIDQNADLTQVMNKMRALKMQVVTFRHALTHKSVVVEAPTIEDVQAVEGVTKAKQDNLIR